MTHRYFVVKGRNIIYDRETPTMGAYYYWDIPWNMLQNDCSELNLGKDRKNWTWERLKPQDKVGLKKMTVGELLNVK